MTNRVGIVGLGLMGRVHARNIVNLGGRVVSGADVSPAARDEFEEEFDVQTYDDYSALFANESLDAAVITTPNCYHEPAARAALEADCDVFIEKPLAHTLEAAERLAETVDRASGFCMVGFHSRFSPAAVLVREYRDAGRFGDIEHVEASFVRQRGIPKLGSWFTDGDLAGGGALIDIGGHVIDLALDVLEFPAVAEVSGVTRSNFGTRPDYADPEGFGSPGQNGTSTFDVDDSVSAFIRCESGQTISLEVAWATNRAPSKELLVRGTEAGARFEPEGAGLTLYEASDRGLDHYVTSEITAGEATDGHVSEMQCFLDSINGTPPSTNTITEGLAVQRVIDAIYQSNERGGVFSLKPTRVGQVS